jgi:hypothetical protein
MNYHGYLETEEVIHLPFKNSTWKELNKQGKGKFVTVLFF